MKAKQRYIKGERMATLTTLAIDIDTIVQRFPDDIQSSMREYTVWMLEELQVSHKDFSELKNTVQRTATLQEMTEHRMTDLTVHVERLAAAQERTEEKVERLAVAQERTEEKVERLTAAQERTEEKVERLAAAQERTEEKVERLAAAQEQLAAAQERTEEKVERLAVAQEQLAAAQERTEYEIRDLKTSLSNQIAALGSRWGIYNEGTFRSTIQKKTVFGVLKEVEGMTVEEGVYGGRQVDVIIRNGEHILLEITSRMHAKDIDKLYQSADDYEVQEGVRPKLMVATSYISPKLMQKIMGLSRQIEIFSYEAE